jgi:ubiquinone/menaquinone biosynthesis C-methylase UbiE
MKKSSQYSVVSSQQGVRKALISRKLLGGIVLLSLLLRLGMVSAQEHHPHHPMPLDQYITLLEDSTRDEWQKPDAVVQALNFQPGQVVADIGAGSGYFTLRLARAVEPKGTVLAVDVDAGMLDYLRQRLAQNNVKNVQVMKVPAHDPLLIDGSLDLAFVCNVYHHLEDREVYMRKVRKALKPNGRLVIVDFYKKEGIPVGPPMHMRLSEDEVQKELQTAGLKVTEKLTLLPYQYILIVQATTAASSASPTGGP